MNRETQIERDERQLEDDFANGTISIEQYHKAMNAMRREFREEAEEAAQAAFDQEMNEWGY